MSNEEKSIKMKQSFYVVTVVEEFSTKKEIETYLLENELAEDEVIVKGKRAETRASVAIV